MCDLKKWKLELDGSFSLKDCYLYSGLNFGPGSYHKKLSQGRRNRENQKMLSGPSEDKKSSEKMVEGEDGLRTVDCLRGRLLAERATSKAAKEDAEVMGKRLIELERKVMQEIEYKKKAEKKLKFAMKKLESLKLSPALGRSTSSENEGPGSSSTCCNSENTREKPDPSVSQDLNYSGADKGVTPMASSEGSWSSVSTAYSNSNGDLSKEKKIKFIEGFSSGVLVNDALRSPAMGKETELGRSLDEMESKNNELAIGPASMWYQSEEASRPQINSEDIYGVLVALRHAKEQLQSSMGRGAAAVNFQRFESCSNGITNQTT